MTALAAEHGEHAAAFYAEPEFWVFAAFVILLALVIKPVYRIVVTALDDRVKCAVVSGYFYGYKQSLLEQHQNCSCNYVPRLYEHVDMGDVGALIAPVANNSNSTSGARFPANRCRIDRSLRLRRSQPRTVLETRRID